MKKIIRKENKKENEKWPLINDKYYYITGSGNILNTRWKNDSIDISFMNMGNFFKTKEEAEKKLRLTKTIAKIKRWQKENDPKKKPWNKGELYFHITYNCGQNNLWISEGINLLREGYAFTFSTFDIAEKCIDELEDDLIWYFQNY